jgi:hypothetical protein
MSTTATMSETRRAETTRHRVFRAPFDYHYEVRVNARPRGWFEDLRDAIDSATIARSERPGSQISVADQSGKIVIEIEP